MTDHASNIRRQLADLGSTSTFATRFSMQADPQLQIEGVGPVALPLSIQTAHRLCAAAQPARHGYKDETRLDPQVRDTWEVEAGRIRIDSPQWPDVLERALQRIQKDLGLPRTSRITAELHNLLVYGPGQFFAVHQDSEKASGMLGTLIVSLPSEFSGGEFVVSHQGSTLSAKGSARQLDMVAFYADCLHEVRPVKKGYRAVLTYNLIMHGGERPDEVPPQRVAALADALHQFWHAPPPPRWRDDARQPPNRLVYLLDHQYTPSGLSWRHLKGIDSVRAAALRAAAQRLDAEIFLALADVHETWSAEDDYQARGYWQEEEEDDEDAEDSEDDPALTDLIESHVELRHWIAPDGTAPEAAASDVDDSELCMTRDSVDCQPFRSEHEGYMGNYGNTVDRWYHRAAVVLWPRERAFVMRAELSPLWAIEAIAGKMEAGEQTQAQEWLQSLLPIWQWAASAMGDGKLLGATLPVAAALDDADAAAALLAPFSLPLLAPHMSPALLRLLQRHGPHWCGELLQRWTRSSQQADAQLAWLAQMLPALAQDWSAGAASRALAVRLIQECWAWLQSHVTLLRTHTDGSERLQALTATGGAWLGLLRASAAAGQPDLQQQMAQALLATELPLQLPLGVLHAAVDEGSSSVTAALAAVHAHGAQTLAARLAMPERAAGDWSVSMPPTPVLALDKALAPTLAQFLAAADRQRLEWPLAEAKRGTVEQFIRRHELPVKCETLRRGRPYTLVLQKTKALFAQAAAERLEWTQELAWLRQVADRFAATP